MIIYFTGTGNSQYLAELIAKQTDDEIIDASHLIKIGKHPDLHSEKPYVFVSPVYAWRLPRVFETWIRNCNFSGNKNTYFLMTCGLNIGTASTYTEKLCRTKGFHYMGTAEVVMPENYIAMFSAPSEEKSADLIEKAKEKTQNLTCSILSDSRFRKIKPNPIRYFLTTVMSPLFYRFSVSAKKFYATDACISCGKCVDNCMLNNIVLKDGKPMWANTCTHCMACICKCPTEAIEYGRHTKGLRRYICKPET